MPVYNPYLRIDCCCAQPTCYQPLTFDFQTNVVVPISININMPAHSCGIPAKNLSRPDVLFRCNRDGTYRGLASFDGSIVFVVSDGVAYHAIFDNKLDCAFPGPWSWIEMGVGRLAELDYEPAPYVKSFINDIGNSNPFLRFDTKTIRFDLLDFVCGLGGFGTHVACSDVYVRYIQLLTSYWPETGYRPIDTSYIFPINVVHFVYAQLAFPLVTAFDLRPFSDDYTRIYLSGDVWFRLPVLLSIRNKWRFRGQVELPTGRFYKELFVSIESYYGAVLDLPFPQMPGTSLQFRFLGLRVIYEPITRLGESLNNIFPDALQVPMNTTAQLTFLGFERSPSYDGVIDWYTIFTFLDESVGWLRW